jgi:hypothetical protein
MPGGVARLLLYSDGTDGKAEAARAFLVAFRLSGVVQFQSGKLKLAE